MTSAATAWLGYEWRGRVERMARVGEAGPAILFLAPLFEEANRTRHFLIETMRGLAARGYQCFLPDLPGTLESRTRLDSLDWEDWAGAVRAAAALAGACHVAAFRGGALLDGAIAPLSRWRLTPADGAMLMRDLVRIRLAADRESGATTSAAEIEARATIEPFEVAGYRLAPEFVGGMKAAALGDGGPLRIARLATEAQPADAKIEGQPLWRRTEPEHDAVFSQNVVNDISAWIASCGAG